MLTDLLEECCLDICYLRKITYKLRIAWENILPLCCGWLQFDQYKIMQKKWKNTITLAHGYLSESTQRELFDEYQHNGVPIVFRNPCIIVLWMKVAIALERLIQIFEGEFWIWFWQVFQLLPIFVKFSSHQSVTTVVRMVLGTKGINRLTRRILWKSLCNPLPPL